MARVAVCLFCAVLAAQTGAPGREKKVALIIGNDHYKYVTPLRTPVSDARAIEAVLRDRYGFETTLLADASRADIMKALSEYRRTLAPDASLLIYYAGHGYSDRAVDKAYWWPVDARPEDVSQWISADDITTSLKAIQARHILVVADSCFSGGLSRGVTPLNPIAPGAGRGRTLLKMRERPSRELFASGGDEPVADGGADGHSIFAASFLRALQNMDAAEFSVQELFPIVRESVGGRSGQLPQFDTLRNSGHDGGSFVFSRAPLAVLAGPPLPVPVAPPPSRTPSPASVSAEPPNSNGELAGTWRGRYLRSLIDGDDEIAFIVNLTFKGPDFAGQSWEYKVSGLRGRIIGTLHGDAVRFTKTWESDGGVVRHTETFSGKLDRAAQSMEGTWIGEPDASGKAASGTFLLRLSSASFEIK